MVANVNDIIPTDPRESQLTSGQTHAIPGSASPDSMLGKLNVFVQPKEDLTKVENSGHNGLVESFREAYPGRYDHLDDFQLNKAILDAYPTNEKYKSLQTVPATPEYLDKVGNSILSQASLADLNGGDSNTTPNEAASIRAKQQADLVDKYRTVVYAKAARDDYETSGLTPIQKAERLAAGGASNVGKFITGIGKGIWDIGAQTAGSIGEVADPTVALAQKAEGIVNAGSKGLAGSAADTINMGQGTVGVLDKIGGIVSGRSLDDQILKDFAIKGWQNDTQKVAESAPQVSGGQDMPNLQGLSRTVGNLATMEGGARVLGAAEVPDIHAPIAEAIGSKLPAIRDVTNSLADSADTAANVSKRLNDYSVPYTLAKDVMKGTESMESHMGGLGLLGDAAKATGVGLIASKLAAPAFRATADSLRALSPEALARVATVMNIPYDILRGALVQTELNQVTGQETTPESLGQGAAFGLLQHTLSPGVDPRSIAKSDSAPVTTRTKLDDAFLKRTEGFSDYGDVDKMRSDLGDQAVANIINQEKSAAINKLAKRYGFKDGELMTRQKGEDWVNDKLAKQIIPDEPEPHAPAEQNAADRESISNSYVSKPTAVEPKPFVREAAVPDITEQKDISKAPVSDITEPSKKPASKSDEDRLVELQAKYKAGDMPFDEHLELNGLLRKKLGVPTNVPKGEPEPSVPDISEPPKASNLGESSTDAEELDSLRLHPDQSVRLAKAPVSEPLPKDVQKTLNKQLGKDWETKLSPEAVNQIKLAATGKLDEISKKPLANGEVSGIVSGIVNEESNSEATRPNSKSSERAESQPTEKVPDISVGEPETVSNQGADGVKSSQESVADHPSTIIDDIKTTAKLAGKSGDTITQADLDDEMARLGFTKGEKANSFVDSLTKTTLHNVTPENVTAVKNEDGGFHIIPHSVEYATDSTFDPSDRSLRKAVASSTQPEELYRSLQDKIANSFPSGVGMIEQIKGQVDKAGATQDLLDAQPAPTPLLGEKAAERARAAKALKTGQSDKEVTALQKYYQDNVWNGMKVGSDTNGFDFTGEGDPKNPLAFKKPINLTDKLAESKLGVTHYPETHTLSEVGVESVDPTTVANLDDKFGKGKWIIKSLDEGKSYGGRGNWFAPKVEKMANNVNVAQTELGKFGLLIKDGVVVDAAGMQPKLFGEAENIWNGVKTDAADLAALNKEIATSKGGKIIVQKAYDLPDGGVDRTQNVGPQVGGGEMRVHLLTTPDGDVKVVPYASWYRGPDSWTPQAIQTPELTSAELSAKKAVEALPKEERSGQFFGTDMIKTKDGSWKLVEYNPAKPSNDPKDPSPLLSGYAFDNAMTQDAIASAVQGKLPFHAKIARMLLEGKLKSK